MRGLVPRMFFLGMQTEDAMLTLGQGELRAGGGVPTGITVIHGT